MIKFNDDQQLFVLSSWAGVMGNGIPGGWGWPEPVWSQILRSFEPPLKYGATALLQHPDKKKQDAFFRPTGLSSGEM